MEGETTGGVTFAVTQAAYDGALLTLEVLLTPNDELGSSPAEALAAGLKHAVRRAAISLAF